MPNSTTTTDESDSRNDEIVYDGNPLRFFDYDRQVTRYAKKLLGATGIKIWNNTIVTPTTANKTTIADAWIADIQDIKGYREAGYMDEDTSWKTVTKLKAKIAKFSDTLRDEIERTTTGNVKNFVQALRVEELPEMREKLKGKFAVVDASQIKAWETLLSNGIMNAWFRHKDNDVDHYPTACPPNRSKNRPQEISLWAGSFQFLPVAYRLCFLISVFLTNITDWLAGRSDFYHFTTG